MRLEREARCEFLLRGSACWTSPRNERYSEIVLGIKVLFLNILLGPCKKDESPTPPNHPHRHRPHSGRVFHPRAFGNPTPDAALASSRHHPWSASAGHQRCYPGDHTKQILLSPVKDLHSAHLPHQPYMASSSLMTLVVC